MSLNINSLNAIKQRQLYKKRRKLTLVKSYYEGLIVELPIQLENQKKLKLDQINKYYKIDKYALELSKDTKRILSEELKHKLEKFTNKRVLARRRTKVVNKDNPELNIILERFDNETDILVKEIKNSVKEIELTDEGLVKINAKENKVEKGYESELTKINKLFENKSAKLQVKVEKLKKVLDTKMIKISKTVETINKNEVVNDEKNQINLNLLKEKLNNNSLSKKLIDKTNEEIKRIEQLMEMKKEREVQLSVDGLKMYFGGIKAVNDLSFKVKKGEIFGLIGPNGAGKTTVFNCITQFYKPTAGTIYFNNKENHIVELTGLKTHDIINEGIARSFQNVELIWELTVLDNLMVSAHSLLITNLFDHMRHSKKLKREEFILRSKGYKILEMLGISEYAFRSPYGLPYGVLKKIELARTLMTDPTMIILDEPAAGLNDQETKDLAQVIKKINTDLGITIFLVEHDMGLVMSICARICAISFGRLLGVGTPKEIQNNPEVRKAYLGDDSDE